MPNINLEESSKNISKKDKNNEDNEDKDNEEKKDPLKKRVKSYATTSTKKTLNTVMSLLSDFSTALRKLLDQLFGLIIVLIIVMVTIKIVGFSLTLQSQGLGGKIGELLSFIFNDIIIGVFWMLLLLFIYRNNFYNKLIDMEESQKTSINQ